MNKEFFEALDALEKEGISKTYLLEKVEAALQTAFKKENNGQSNVRVSIDDEKKTVRVFEQFTVVEEVTDPACELTVAEAKEINKRLKLGDVYEKEVKTKNFNRISAQAAKMVIIQGIREAERQMLVDEYEQKKNDIVSARIVLIDKNTGNAILELGKQQATLFKTEQIPGEILRSGQYLKVYVVDIKTDTKEPVIVLSRKHPGLVKRLFELEVPEIADGTIIIKGVAREAGSRTKIAVYSRDENVEAVGSCIGKNSMRINAILAELSGEKVDVIKYSDDTCEYVKAALAPARVVDVYLEDERTCRVTVNPDQLSLAIGAGGQNAKLVARLTGCKIDIKA